jgi:hypothetical protein
MPEHLKLPNEGGPGEEDERALPARNGSLPSEAARDLRIEDYLDRVLAPLAEAAPFEKRQELRAELAAHLDALVEARVELGSPPSEAVAEALKQFGEPGELGRQWAAAWTRPSGERLSPINALLGGLVFGGAAGMFSVPWVLAVEPWRLSPWDKLLGGPLFPLVAGLFVGLYHGRHPFGSRWGLLMIALSSLGLSCFLPGPADLPSGAFAVIRLLLWVLISCGTAGLGFLWTLWEQRMRHLPALPPGRE